MIAVRLSPEVEKSLKKLARKTGRTTTFYVREAILQHLDDRGLLPSRSAD
jgi:RHH-type rel operon transcriptional repressor/antitoxin RelB